MKKSRFFLIILGLANILVGLYSAIFIFLMQGFYLIFLGLTFIIFGIGLLIDHFYYKLIYFGIFPFTLLFTYMIMLLSISKEVPYYYKIPSLTGVLIIIPLWIVILTDIYVKPKSPKI